MFCPFCRAALPEGAKFCMNCGKTIPAVPPAETSNPDPATGLPVITCTDPESIALLLSTTSAHSYQFIAPALPQGVYKVMLHIGATADATTTSVGFNSQVAVGVGVGSLTAQIVQVQTPFNSLCFDLLNGTDCR